MLVLGDRSLLLLLARRCQLLRLWDSKFSCYEWLQLTLHQSLGFVALRLSNYQLFRSMGCRHKSYKSSSGMHHFKIFLYKNCSRIKDWCPHDAPLRNVCIHRLAPPSDLYRTISSPACTSPGTSIDRSTRICIFNLNWISFGYRMSSFVWRCLFSRRHQKRAPQSVDWESSTCFVIAPAHPSSEFTASVPFVVIKASSTALPPIAWFPPVSSPCHIQI